jgi:Zn-dependent peptidase ImmA (M78 family)
MRNGQMNKIVEDSLYNKDKKKFEYVKEKSIGFCMEFIGNNIMRDDIFSIITRYTKTKELKCKLLRFPINDNELCAFTCIKKDTIFVTINTAIPLGKQIFAAAHELYHIMKYVENDGTEFLSEGSLLTTTQMEDGNLSDEDREANAFAALILAPKTNILEQVQIHGIDFSDLSFKDIIICMDIFAMPYKAMVMRFFECECIDKEKTGNLLRQEEANAIVQFCQSHDIDTRWLIQTPHINNIETIRSLILKNKEDETVPEHRIKEDIDSLASIVSIFPKQ